MKGSAPATTHAAGSGFAGRMKSAEIETSLRRLDRFAFLLDEAFRIPGTRWRVGLDGLCPQCRKSLPGIWGKSSGHGDGRVRPML